MDINVASIKLRHNIEVAHRLFELPGKCENIHGHSMWIELEIMGGLNSNGILVVDGVGALEFGDVKKRFRSYLDTNYDHNLLLNEKDPWSQAVVPYESTNPVLDAKSLPGLRTVPGDPTTEHLALWIAEWAQHCWPTDIKVTVQETAVNAATIILPYEV